jgi:hypothetical protein
MSYLGRSAKLSLKAQEKVSFLATAGQTSKTGLSYTVGFIEVYVNGVLLTDTTDFTATNGNSITFTVALLVNDEVTVISLKTFASADHYNKTEADALLAAKATVANFTSTGIDDNATSTAVTISDSGVLIGSGSLQGDLTIGNTGVAEIVVWSDTDNNGDANAYINYGYGGTSGSPDRSWVTGTKSSGSYVIASRDNNWADTGDTPKLEINSAGNVGIGVTPANNATPASGLQVGATASIGAWESGSNIITTIGSNSYFNSTYKYITTNTAALIRLINGAINFSVAPSGTADAAISWTTAMTIDNAGKLAIGTATHGNAAYQSTLQIASGTGGLYFRKYNTATNYPITFRTTSGSQTGFISVTESSTSYNTSSDYRLKENVTPMSGATAAVKLLKPCNFDWIVGGNVNGFLAHELAEVVPEAVTGTKDAMMDEEYEVTPAVVDDEGNETTAAVMGTRSVPDMQGIDQAKLVPLLTATIQELIARIEALEGE